MSEAMVSEFLDERKQYSLSAASNTFNKKLLVICHAYNNFQKDMSDSVANYFSSVDIIVRNNPIVNLGKIVSIPQLERINSPYYAIDLRNTPTNVRVKQSHVWYIPTNHGYEKLGKKHYSSVRRIIQRNGILPGIIHAHFLWSSGYVGARLKEDYDVPLVITGHGYDVYSLPFKSINWRRRIENVLNAADYITTVSNSNLAYIKKLDISSPIKVIHNGFKSDLFNPRDSMECRRALNLPMDKKIILAVGNLEPIKGHRYLIEAINKIVQIRKDILCVFVGAGQLHKSLDYQIHSLGLDEYVKMVGGKTHDEIPCWMNACDLLVLPSLRESFGVVQVEAMACGKPVVATRNGGSEEIVTSGNYGLIAKPADSDDLAEKILKALNKDWNRQTILEYSSNFTLQKTAREMMTVYENAAR